MCACSREERHYDPVTDDKTGTADTLAGTELDVRTFFTFPWTTQDMAARLDFNLVEQ